MHTNYYGKKTMKNINLFKLYIYYTTWDYLYIYLDIYVYV